MASIFSRDFTEDDVQRILEQEASIFPLASPVPTRVVHRWTSTSPQFSRVYFTLSPVAIPAAIGHGSSSDESSRDVHAPPCAAPTIVGNMACVVLKAAAWERLVAGEIEEGDLIGEQLFSHENGDLELGIHLYHVENEARDAWKCAGEHMRTRALQDLGRAMDDLRQIAPATRCVGFSALSVTPSGINLCSNVWNMYEPPARSRQYVFEDHNGAQRLELACTLAEYLALVKRAKRTPLRTRMLITRPGDQSLVWNYV